MGILDDNDEFLEQNGAEERDPVYDNSEDKARLDFQAAAYTEKNSDESEDQNSLKIEDEIILAELAGRCQVRADSYSQITIISINGCKYFTCNTCPQQYKQSPGTKNILDHLFKSYR